MTWEEWAYEFAPPLSLFRKDHVITHAWGLTSDWRLIESILDCGHVAYLLFYNLEVEGQRMIEIWKPFEGGQFS